jgi:DNA-binding transcriptional regulator PaaX
MKKTSQVLLISLLQTKNDTPKPLLRADQLRTVVPNLSASGFRSLLYLLEHQGMIAREFMGNEFGYILTKLGAQALTAELPALSDRYESWEGEWVVLLFLTAPKGDPQFRYLRSLVVSQGAVALNRGVYLGAGGFSSAVMAELETTYNRSVILLQAGEWYIGSERPIVIKTLGLNDIIIAYSGISREVDRLTDKFSKKSMLNNQSKIEIYSVLTQFLTVLQEDPGFATRYMARVVSPFEILARIQRLLVL